MVENVQFLKVAAKRLDEYGYDILQFANMIIKNNVTVATWSCSEASSTTRKATSATRCKAWRKRSKCSIC